MRLRTFTSCAAVVFLAACSDQPTSTARSFNDGASLSGQVSASFAFEGAPAQSFGKPTAYTARVDGGIARQEVPAESGALSLGRVVAVSDALSDETPSTRTRKFLNPEGRMIEVAFEYLGRRNVAISYRVNGERTASVVKRWRRGDGGWVLEGAEVTSYEGGEAKARLNLTAGNVQVARRAPLSEKLAAVALGATAFVLPTRAHAQDCSDEKRNVILYGGLSAVACGTGAFLACAGAMIAFYNALDTLEECAA